MIFAATHKQVLAGRKTQTRRLLRPYPGTLPARRPPKYGKAAPAPAKWPRAFKAFDQVWCECTVQPGRSYAVQPGRGKHALARIVVTDVRAELVGEITFDDARREGFRTTADFKRTWLELHDARWYERTRVILDEVLPLLATELDQVEAQLDGQRARSLLRRHLNHLNQLTRAGAVQVDPDDEYQPPEAWHPVTGALDVAVQHRFETRHAHRPVWVITFELEHDGERLLRAGPGIEGMDEGDYTRSPSEAMPGELPPVDAATLARFSADGEFTSRMRRAHTVAEKQEARGVLELHERLRELEARPAGADVTRELRAIRQRIEQAEKRVNRGQAEAA